MSETYDFIIVGGGIAGVSAGYFLAPHGRVLLLERETALAYHTTGRSAALYTQAYGNDAVRALTVAGHDFFMDPPAGFAEHALLTPRGAMFVGRADQIDALDRAAAEGRKFVDSIRRVDAAAARDVVPVLRPGYVAGAVLEPDAMDIDVHGLHQGFVRGLRHRGGDIVTEAEVLALARAGADWSVETPRGTFETFVEVPKGEPGNWPTDDEHRAKFDALVGPCLVPDRAAALADALLSLDSQPAIGPVLDLARPVPQAIRAAGEE